MSALDAALRGDVLRRGLATGLPALAAALFMRHSAGDLEGRTVAFASVVANQLAQTLDAGRVERSLSRSVVGAVTGSAGLLVSLLTVPALRHLLGLVAPTPLAWALVGGSALAAVGLGRGLAGLLPSAVPDSPEQEQHEKAEQAGHVLPHSSPAIEPVQGS